MLRESGARVLFVPGEFRGRDYAAMATGLRAELPALEHLVVLDGDALAGDGAVAAPSPRPDAIAQLLFTSGTSGEPKGALHRYDTLTRAADHHIDHFGLGGDDVIYIPSPLAHQTGFLYGMWIALRLGVPQVLQEVWDAGVGLDAMRVRRHVRAGGDAVPGRLVAGRARRAVAPSGAADLRRHRRGDAARARASAREVLGAEVGGAWGTTESCLGARSRPANPPNGLGHRRARACRRPAARRRRRRRARCRRRGGQLRGPHRLPVRRLPGPAGPDRRGGDRGRVVPHRRPGPDRRRRLRADHGRVKDVDQPRRREGAGG